MSRAITQHPRRWPGRPGIAMKLFLAFLLVSVALVGTMLGMVQWSLGAGFRDYLQAAELSRLDRVEVVLAEEYARSGGWQSLRDRPRRWARLLETGGLAVPARRPPPPPRHGHRPPPPPPPHDSLSTRLGLLDAAGQPVAGRPVVGAAQRRPVIHGDEAVGWLALRPRAVSDDGLAYRFLAHQTRLLYLIAALGLLFAAVSASLLADHLLGPLRVLTRGARALTAGDLATRIELQRHDELGALARDFDRLARTLEDNECARRRWVADISHELRTPLAILRGELEALEDGVRDWNPATLASLQGEVGRLQKLVADLYELARSELGSLSYRKVSLDLGELLTRVLDNFATRLAEHRLEVTPTLPASPVMILADPDRLTQLFANLLNNTLAYTDPGGKLALRCRIADGQAMMDLQDSAPGVPADALPRLFERLYRVEASRNRARGGAGLGLAICRNIVVAHDGEIHARPSPLGGLWIEIRLPLDSTTTP